MLLALAAGSPAQRQVVEDVFLVNLRTGTGATASVTGGPNLATHGGMVHTKSRNNATTHTIQTSTIGVTKRLRINTDAESTVTDLVTGFTSDGFTLGADAGNSGGNFNSSYTYVDWIYRNAPKFFKETTVTKSSGVSATVDLSTLGTVGMVKVKRTDAAGSWYVWHRSLTAGKLLIGETTAAETTLGHITVSGTTLTLVDGVIADGTYHIEAYAHDTSTDGLIQCGSFTTDGSGNATVTLGWEPQFVLKRASTTADNWTIRDSMRGMPAAPATNGADLFPHNSNAESAAGANGTIVPTATGFAGSGLIGSQTYIYLAIRRGPMRFPTSGTQVYQAIARTGTGAAATVTGVGFPPDLTIIQSRAGAAPRWGDRLRGVAAVLRSNLTNAELTTEADLASFDMDGITLTGTGASLSNASATAYINHFFRRYPGVFDQVCYTGTGVAKTEAHNLGVVPELMIVKGRTPAGTVEADWAVYSGDNTKVLALNSTAAGATSSNSWNNTSPTSSVFTVGNAATVNRSACTFVWHGFATLAGISKVFDYVGDGTSGRVINCGFAAGARFILLKSAGTTMDWLLWDSVRGIVAGSDPFLALNSTAAENTATDYIDPDASGFAVNSALNSSGVQYIGFAIA